MDNKHGATSSNQAIASIASIASSIDSLEKLTRQLLEKKQLNVSTNLSLRSAQHIAASCVPNAHHPIVSMTSISLYPLLQSLLFTSWRTEQLGQVQQLVQLRQLGHLTQFTQSEQFGHMVA